MVILSLRLPEEVVKGVIEIAETQKWSKNRAIIQMLQFVIAEVNSGAIELGTAFKKTSAK